MPMAVLLLIVGCAVPTCRVSRRVPVPQKEVPTMMPKMKVLASLHHDYSCLDRCCIWNSVRGESRSTRTS